MPPLSRSSRSILFRGNLGHFPGDTLFARIARAVCEAECLPRKELYEAWETARRIRRQMRGGPVVELAAGHGLLAMILIILDDTTETALCIDVQRPPSHATLLAVMERHWPRLQGRIEYHEARVEDAVIPPGAILASVHACGALTDRVLDLALAGGHRVAVLPCCHDLQKCDTGSLEAWMDGPLAVDATRAARLRQAGYRVQTATIPGDITPKNRLLLGWPP
ncbi:MAG: methyltransferase [Candidatus Krumholzibacteriia bacterium]